MPTYNFDQIFADVNKVLVVLAHPDDLEVFAGGTIAKLIKAGKEVRSVKVTNGNKGSRDNLVSATDLAKMREIEDSHSMIKLGIKPENSIFLDINDGEVENSLYTIGKIAYQIREFKPDLIITHNPEDVIINFNSENNWVNHRDHRNVGQSTIDAAYPYSRDTLFYPEHLERVDSHIVVKMLLVDYYNHPHTVRFNINDFVETKIESLKAHGSQFTTDKAKSIVEFMNKQSNGDYFESFRYLVIN